MAAERTYAAVGVGKSFSGVSVLRDIHFELRSGDFALVGACVTRVGGDVRISLCGATPAPVRARGAELALAAGESAENVGATAAQEVEPWDDVHATAAYRRHIAATLVRRAVEAMAA